eukprot:TRINITY_DN12814_c0_g5_i1.p1 TRINITY_DN12814_c0_g5~~TRINITY_DN12814_c0_g5_i1.p1  ORF type:complete len:556 (-),score=91.42 TRINITY_DN12814_c0_g5_i1:97-1764(-)
MPELLEWPFCADRDNGGESVTQARVFDPEGWLARPDLLVLDLLASIAFWFVLLFVVFTDLVWYSLLATFVVCLVLWRVWSWLVRERDESRRTKVPYTTAVVQKNGRELFLVATLHIAPRAPKDVESVIEITNPDVVMIELDEDRLDRMRDEEIWKNKEPSVEDLQPVRILERGVDDPITIYGQRALWNGEWAGQELYEELVFDESNPHGMSDPSRDYAGRICLVHRGSPEGEFAPFALKAHKVAKAGASGMLVVNKEGALPHGRITSGSLINELRLWTKTCRCGFPPVPVILIPHEDGNRLCEKLKKEGDGAASVQIDIRTDSQARTTLRKRLCQTSALIFSGIGILYGVIQLFSVEVGGEFLAADLVAASKRIPCLCIDVDLDTFWTRIGWALVPTPINLGKAVLAWLALPRILFFAFFPPKGNVDMPGCILLSLWSLHIRTWIAFILAGFAASFVTSHVLLFFTSGAEQMVEKSGAIDVKTDEDRDVLQSYFLLALQVYIMPRMYDAVAASRDEVMYRTMVSKAQDSNAHTMVVVVGAAHSNGILQRVSARGL